MPGRIPRPVWFLGWTSLFTDAATEIIYPLLPVYLRQVLGASATSLGIIEGVAEGVNSLLKIVSGRMADRRARRRPLVIVGYAISSLARPFIALTTAWPQVLAIRALDRTGKGIRGAPRDAMLARFADASSRGRIFGFHRAMDHTGAIIGPLIATAFLFVLPGHYRALLLLTAIPGALAVAMLFFVQEPQAAPDDGSRADLLARRSPGEGGKVRPYDSPVDTGAKPALPQVTVRPRLPGRLFAVLGVIVIFSLGNSADAFLLLRLTDALGSGSYIPLLWAALHVVKASLSTWGGAVSDRIGRKRVMVIGWSIYALVYVGFAQARSVRWFVFWFLAYGVYFALSEGAEKALVADLTPAGLHGTAFGYYNAALGVGTLVASILFGFLYDRFGASTAFGVGAALAGLAALLLVAVPVGARPDRR